MGHPWLLPARWIRASFLGFLITAALQCAALTADNPSPPPGNANYREIATLPPCYEFQVMEGFEKGSIPTYSVGGNPTWGPTNYLSSTGTYSAWCARAGTLGRDPATSSYRPSMKATMTWGPFDLRSVNLSAIAYSAWVDTQPLFDGVILQFSTDGRTYSNYGDALSGRSLGWNFRSGAFASETLPSQWWWRLTFASNASVQYKGVFLDDIWIWEHDSPTNDNFENAVTLSGEQGSVLWCNEGGSLQHNEPVPSDDVKTLYDNTVWFSWTCPRTAYVRFDTLTPHGNSFAPYTCADSILRVFVGDTITGIGEEAMNNDDPFSESLMSRLMFHAYAGTTYRIAVASDGDQGGAFRLSWGSHGWLNTKLDEPCADAPTWIPAGNSSSSAMGRGVEYDWDAAAQALRLRTYNATTYAGSVRHRIGGWYALLEPDVMPYAAVGSDHIARGKFYVYATGQTAGATNRIPPFQLRLSTGYQVTANLEITPHLNELPGDQFIMDDFAPSRDPNLPSIYRVDLHPIETPYLESHANDLALAIRPSFAIQALDPQDNGYVCLTECVVGTYPESMLAMTLQDTYEDEWLDPALSEAAVAYNVVPGTVEGSNGTAQIPVAYGGTYAGADVPTIAYHDYGAVTHDCANVPATKIGVTTQFFSNTCMGLHSLRDVSRAYPDRQYIIRYALCSGQQADKQSAFWLHVRSAGFAYAQKLEFAGAHVMPNVSDPDNCYARELLPQASGCMFSPIFYTMLMYTPMSPDIGEQPDLWAQPGPGVNLPSYRDIKPAFMLIDGFNNSTPGGELEQGEVTVYQITVSVSEAVVD